MNKMLELGIAITIKSASKSNWRHNLGARALLVHHCPVQLSGYGGRYKRLNNTALTILLRPQYDFLTVGFVLCYQYLPASNKLLVIRRI